MSLIEILLLASLCSNFILLVCLGRVYGLLKVSIQLAEINQERLTIVELLLEAFNKMNANEITFDPEKDEIH